MKRKSTFYITALSISIIMIIVSQFVELNSLSGLLLGTGAGVFGANIAKLFCIVRLLSFFLRLLCVFIVFVGNVL